MIKLYPNNALEQLEFDKIKNILLELCKTEYAKNRVQNLRIHTKKEFIALEIQQSYEYLLLLQQAQYFPNKFTKNLKQEIKLLSIPGAILSTEVFVQLRNLAENAEHIFRWFDNERQQAYANLYKVIANTYYEKLIIELINDVIDEQGAVKDNASQDLYNIRTRLFRKRNELRRVFEKVVHKLSKAGYSADIEESFSSGRRVVAVFAEHKRQVKGILHGESDSRKTAFIEPEETIELNNEVYSLENEERKEIQRILKQLTATIAVYANLLQQYFTIAGEFDFIEAKAKLALQINGNLPNITEQAVIDVKKAYHPLLLIYNKKNNKTTIPLDLQLNDNDRILIISGPNAGGKTVAMKTIGLNQIMLQSGLLVPVAPTSTMGIFKQIFIHIGDTQSIEFELSTYSSHLLHMKYFTEHVNGKTLFFIDELGGGSDPNLGGAFAEVILEEMCKKHAVGIVTTHYLNLKIMGNKTKGIINGAMAFDEQKLMPKYELNIGKPGSSYTFSIAQRIGLQPHLINRARKLVDENHFKVDKLLNSTEQKLNELKEKEQQLKKLLQENALLKKEMEQVLNKEKHLQQLATLKEQNRIAADRIAYLKDMERKLRQLVLDWKKTDDKAKVINNLKNLLFTKKEEIVVNKLAKKVNNQYKENLLPVEVGCKAKHKINYQVGVVKELKGKRAVLQVGQVLINVNIADLTRVEELHKEM